MPAQLRARSKPAGRLFALPRWAMPDAGLVRGAPDPQHLRMFVLSHICGPFIGLGLSLVLLLLGFPPDARLTGFSILVCLFWLYPPALARGLDYRVLSLVSLQHLTLVIFWASHGYGGLTSPFLLWIAVVPLLASLYSAPQLRRWLVLLSILAVETGLFTAFTFAVPPQGIGGSAQTWLGLLSILSASAYVSMMAIDFGRALSSRNELALEVARRRSTADALDRRASELRQVRSARAASLSWLVRECGQPVDEMLAACGEQAGCDGGSAEPAQASDLENIETAALRLRELLGAIQGFLTAGGTDTDRVQHQIQA